MQAEPITEPISSVLFVCTANQIRSPIAAALFAKKLSEVNPEWWKWRIESAGTRAMEGQRPMVPAELLMKARDVDISNHRSRPITRELIRKFRLIITMDKAQKEALHSEFPEYAERIMMLGELCDDPTEVVDPIGGQPADYHNSVETIERLLQCGFFKIHSLAKK